MQPGRDSARVYPGVRVTLHRVGPDRAAPVDSVLSDAAGRYAFTYRRTGDTTALYFVSASRGGIAYFTAPLHDARVSGEAAEIMLFDTTSAAIPIHVRGRHVVVAAADSDGTRTIVEVFEISNDSSVTRIAAGEGATFETTAPHGATNITAGSGEISAQGLTPVGERVRVVAPLAPGVKQFSFSYLLPASATDVVIPVVATDVLEVLLEDPEARASGAALKAVENARTSGRTFRRFLAQDVKSPTLVAISLPSASAGPRRLRIAIAIIAVGAVLLIGFARAFTRRTESGGAAAGRAASSDEAEAAVAAIERELVQLDDDFARAPGPTVEQRGEHLAARAHVKARLAAAVAARDGIG